jgi:hypothetical protein
MHWETEESSWEQWEALGSYIGDKITKNEYNQVCPIEI